jgi:NAD(P)H-nitrite reductase large subunit
MDDRITDRQLRWLAENGRIRKRYGVLSDATDRVEKELTKSAKGPLRVAQTVWAEYFAGTELADLAFPSGLKNGTLEVSVTEPAVMFALQQMQGEALLEMLRQQVGLTVRDIRYTLTRQ